MGNAATAGRRRGVGTVRMWKVTGVGRRWQVAHLARGAALLAELRARWSGSVQPRKQRATT
jgi:hypothetical protein